MEGHQNRVQTREGAALVDGEVAGVCDGVLHRRVGAERVWERFRFLQVLGVCIHQVWGQLDHRAEHGGNADFHWTERTASTPGVASFPSMLASADASSISIWGNIADNHKYSVCPLKSPAHIFMVTVLVSPAGMDSHSIVPPMSTCPPQPKSISLCFASKLSPSKNI